MLELPQGRRICVQLKARCSGRPNWFGIPQAEWVRDVTDVSMFEKYNMEMERICTKFSIPYACTARNTSERQHYSEYYDRKDLIAAVGQIDAEIVNRFGYTFG
ncbi:hypothetical protein FHS74_002706 [Nitrospirillum iridis]|uniref:Uncharacterized protein n=2 Tax=Nitrospirillum iridis TaxID=765888 RepID=A0A7X0AZE2_9PROT|nr:hypothetical protein [Nitrospirillum iridis]